MGASVNKEIAGALIPLRKRYIRKHFTHERRKNVVKEVIYCMIFEEGAE